jgi:hypothetical protein
MMRDPMCRKLLPTSNLLVITFKHLLIVLCMKSRFATLSRSITPLISNVVIPLCVTFVFDPWCH